MTPVQAADAGTDPRLEALEAFSRAWRREAHVLSERPGLVWQQMYNRLQWEGDPTIGLLEPQLRGRSAPGATPWIRTRTRPRESDALRLTLTGHTDQVNACAISPDSDFIVTASSDHTAKIWDAATGRGRATLSVQAHRWKEAFAISPDSAYIVTTSFDHTAKIWAAATGAERATLTGHTGTV